MSVTRHHMLPSTYFFVRSIPNVRPLPIHAAKDGIGTDPNLPAALERPVEHMNMSKAGPWTRCCALPRSTSSTFLATPAACNSQYPSNWLVDA
jgi:hypothetical protein